MELEAQRQLVLVPGLQRPGQPAHEAVNGVVALRFVEGGLSPDAVELEAAVGQPVRPGGQHLAATRMRPLVGPEAVDDRVVGEGKPGPVTKEIQQVYFSTVRGEVDRYKEWLDHVD